MRTTQPKTRIRLFPAEYGDALAAPEPAPQVIHGGHGVDILPAACAPAHALLAGRGEAAPGLMAAFAEAAMADEAVEAGIVWRGVWFRGHGIGAAADQWWGTG